MAARKRGIRPLLIESMKQVKRTASAAQNAWTVNAYVYEPRVEGGADVRCRPRQSHEYPENLLFVLTRTERQLESIMVEADHARMLILDRIREIEERK